MFSSGFVGNGYGLCSIINGFQRVDLFGVSRNPEVGTFLYFKAGIPFGAGRDSKVYFLINDWNDVFCSAPDGVGLSVFGRLQILDDGFLVRFHHVQAGILEFLFDNADKFEPGLVFCILTGTELAVGLDDVFPDFLFGAVHALKGKIIAIRLGESQVEAELLDFVDKKFADQGRMAVGVVGMSFGRIFLLHRKSIVVRVPGQDVRVNEFIFQSVVQEPFVRDVAVDRRTGDDVKGFHSPLLNPEIGGDEAHILLRFLGNRLEFVGGGKLLAYFCGFLDAGRRFDGFFRNLRGEFVFVIQSQKGQRTIGGHSQAQDDSGCQQDFVVILFFRHVESICCGWCCLG